MNEIEQEIENMTLEEKHVTLYSLEGRIYLGHEKEPTELGVPEDYQTTKFYLKIQGIEGDGEDFITWYLQVVAETPWGESVLDETITDHTCTIKHVTGGYKLSGDVPSDFADEIIETLQGLEVLA